MCLAHWTFTQRTIRVVLPNKTEELRHDKPFPTGTIGDRIRAQRTSAGMTREQLSQVTGIPVYWLGRWERDRSIPNRKQLSILSAILRRIPK